MKTLAEKYIERVNALEAQKREHEEDDDWGDIWFWKQIGKIPECDEDVTAAADPAETNSAIGFSDHSFLEWRDDWGKWVLGDHSTTLAEKYIEYVNALEDEKGEHDDGGDQGDIWFWDQIRKMPDCDEVNTYAGVPGYTNSVIAFSDGSALFWRQDQEEWV